VKKNKELQNKYSAERGHIGCIQKHDHSLSDYVAM